MSTPPPRLSGLRDVIASRAGVVIVIALIGLAVSISVFNELMSERRATVSSQFERAAADRARVIRQAFDQQIDVLAALSAHLRTLAVPSRAGFEQFANALLGQSPGTHALSWNPRVPARYRGHFEAAAARELPGYQIMERSDAGTLSRARRRPEYYSVLYIEPLARNLAAVGYDIGSEQIRRDAVWHARDSGKAVASAPLQLVQDRETQPSLLIVEPIYRSPFVPETLEERRRSFLGVAVAVVHVRDLIEGALGVLGPGGVDLALYDASAVDRTTPVYVHASRTRTDDNPTDTIATLQSAPLRMEWSFWLGERKWRVTAAAATGRFPLSAALEARVALFSGLLLTILTCVIVDRLVNRSRRLEQERQQLESRVAARTSELERAHRSLLRQERLAAIGQVTGTVAHELRNPLSTISMTFSALREGLKGDESHLQRAVARIERSIERCNNVINDLLYFAGGREPALEVADVEHWLREILADYSIPDSIELHEDFNAAGIKCAIDRELLRRAFVNLLDNAVQAVGQRADTEHEAGRVEISTATHEGALQLVVADDGIGMDDDVRQEIFEPLFSTKRSGTGLGLSIVARAVAQHEGDVRVSSERNVGTRIVISLPITGHDNADQPSSSAT